MNNRIYTEGSISRHLFKLSWPAFLSIIANLSYILIETYFVSQLGTYQLIAISFIFPIISTFQMVGLAFGISASSILSNYIGEKRQARANAFMKSLFIFTLLLSVISTLAGLFTINLLFRSLGATHQVLPFVERFMKIWYIGIFFVYLNYIVSSILRVYGFPKISGGIQILSAIFNILLAPLFILLMHWGMSGAALASLLARIFSISISIFYIYKFNIYTNVKLNIQKFVYFCKKAIYIIFPATLTNIIGPLSSVWMVHLLTHYNQTLVAGYGIAARTEQFFLIPLYALSASVGPIIGQNRGAKLYERSYITLKKGYLYSLIFGLISMLLMASVGYHIIVLFSNNHEVLKVARFYLWIVPISYSAWGILMITNANFNVIGKPHISTLLTIFRLVIVFLPLSLLLQYLLGYTGIFLAFSIANFVAALVAVYTAFNLSSISAYTFLTSSKESI